MTTDNDQVTQLAMQVFVAMQGRSFDAENIPPRHADVAKAAFQAAEAFFYVLEKRQEKEQ
jgi:hypothetical protein